MTDKDTRIEHPDNLPDPDRKKPMVGPASNMDELSVAAFEEGRPK